MAQANEKPAVSLVSRLWVSIDSLRKFLREFTQTRSEANTRAVDFGKRPSGWLGHWSVRYGELLARTVNLYPPFRQAQSELLSGIPQPMHEALDPVASVAEPMDRDGKLVAWRLTRSTTFDLLGSIGIVAGALAFAIVAFSIAVPLLKLPPLLTPKQELQPPKAPGPPQQQQQQQQPLSVRPETP
jgi:hypothetical protein